MEYYIVKKILIKIKVPRLSNNIHDIFIMFNKSVPYYFEMFFKREIVRLKCY